MRSRPTRFHSKTPFQKNKKLGLIRRLSGLKALADKPDNLSWVPVTHGWKERTDPLK